MANCSIQGLVQMAPENEVATVLSHFNSQYIYDVIGDKLLTRFNPMNFSTVQNANIVQAFNQNFKDLAIRYPSNIEHIAEVEKQTYDEIIRQICGFYSIEPPMFDDSVSLDYCFAVAFYMYDFFVSSFFDHICGFFARYIYSNKETLYDVLDLDSFRKNKDSSTLYGKNVFKDIKTAVISANVMMVVRNISSFDVLPQTILNIVYGNENIVSMLSTILDHYVGGPDFYKCIYCTMPEEILPLMYSNIRTILYQLSAADSAVETQIF